MKLFLILFLAFSVSGCRCEKQFPLAEVAFISWLEPGATTPSDAELEAFKVSLTRLNFKELNQVLEHLNQDHLEEFVPERTQFWATRNDPPPAWEDAAYAVVDELSGEDLSAFDMARILDHSVERSLKAQIFLTQLGLAHPKKGWAFLNRLYAKAYELEDYDYPATTATIFFSATYRENPTLAKELLITPIKDEDYAKYAIRTDAFLGCLFSATTPQEIEELLDLAITHKFQNDYGGFHGIIETIYYTDREALTHLTHGIAVLARMDPKSARNWITQRRDSLDENWGIGYLSGAIGFPEKAPEDFEARYEAAVEFIALNSLPGSKTLERSIKPYGTMTSPQLEALIKKIRDQQLESKAPKPR